MFFMSPTRLSNNFREFPATARQLLSRDVQIFRLRGHTFAINITLEEAQAAKVRLEGMFYFRHRGMGKVIVYSVCLFTFVDVHFYIIK